MKGLVLHLSKILPYQPGKSWVGFAGKALRWGVTMLIGFYLWQALGQMKTELVHFNWILSGRQWIFLTLAVLLLPVNLSLEALKFRVLVLAIPVSYSFGQAMQGVLAGLATGLPTPNRWGEYIGRCATLPVKDRLAGTMALLVVRSSQLLPTLIIGIWALMYLGELGPWMSNLQTRVSGSGWWVGLALVVGIGLLFFHWKRGPIPKKFRKHIRKARGFWSGPRLLLVLFLAHLRYLVFATQFVLLILALGGEWQFGLVAAVAAVFLAKSLVPSVAITELGVREAAAVFFLGALGYSFPVIFLATTVLYGINVLFPALIGLPLWQTVRNQGR